MQASVEVCPMVHPDAGKCSAASQTPKSIQMTMFGSFYKILSPSPTMCLGYWGHIKMNSMRGIVSMQVVH